MLGNVETKQDGKPLNSDSALTWMMSSEALPSLEYIAGFIDGEGTIGLNRLHPSAASKTRKRVLLRPRFQASSTCKKILEDLQEVFGGSISKVRPSKQNHKPGYIWSASYKTFSETLSALLPYLRIKHRQAELVLEATAIIGGIGHQRKHVTEGRQRGQFAYTGPYPKRLWQIHRELKRLNKRGPP